MKRKFFAGLLVLFLSAGCGSLDRKQAAQKEPESRKSRIQMTDRKAALEMLKGALAADPDNPDINFSIGLIHYEQGRAADAGASFQKALRLSRSPKEKKITIEEINRVTTRTKNNKERELLFTARTLIEQKKSLDAIPLLRSAIDSNPMNSNLHYEMGRAFSDNGEKGKAVESYERGRTVNPAHRGILKALKFCCLETGDSQRLSEITDQIIFLYGETPSARLDSARVLWNMKKTDEAVKICMDLTEQYPTYPLTHLLLARICLEGKKDPRKAEEHLKKFFLLLDGRVRLKGGDDDSHSLTSILSMHREAEEMLHRCKKDKGRVR